MGILKEFPLKGSEPSKGSEPLSGRTHKKNRNLRYGLVLGKGLVKTNR